MITRRDLLITLPSVVVGGIVASKVKKLESKQGCSDFMFCMPYCMKARGNTKIFMPVIKT